MRKLIWLLLLSSVPLFGQVAPQIQGAGAPANPCTNGGQDYVDQTNHVLYHCPSTGSNWANIGLGNVYPKGTSLLPTIVASLASYSQFGAGTSVAISDGNSASDCTTGSGSTAVLCQYSGSAWAAVGGGGAGSGTVTSVTFTGDGTVLSSTPSTAVTTSGTLTAAIKNAGAGTLFGNATGSSAAPAYTAAPVLGTAGSVVGSLGFHNATSGTITVQPVTGALGTVTISLPAAAGTVAVSATSPITLSAAGAVGLGTLSAGSNGLATSATTDTTNASNISTGTLGLARGGTNADLSATGGTSQVLKQVSSGAAVTVARLACSDLSNAATSCSTDATVASNISSGFLPPARIAQASYSSGTVTASIAATTLCSTTNCPAGTYLVTLYTNETGTGCTTVGSGAVKLGLAYVNNQALSVSDVSGIPVHNPSTAGIQNSLTLTTTGQGTAEGTYVVNTNGSAVSGSDSIQISAALTACTTPGSWTGYQLRANVVRVN